jgi:hypothetical protein
MTWSQNSSGSWKFVNDGIGYANDPTHANVPNASKLPNPPAANATPSPGGKKDPTGGTPNPNLDPLPKGVQLDWDKFLDGGYVLNSGGTVGAIAGQPYISGAPTPTNPNPKSIVILPSDDGKGYFAQDLDAAVQEYINRIPNVAKETYKKKLKDFYPDSKSYAVSLHDNNNEKYQMQTIGQVTFGLGTLQKLQDIVSNIDEDVQNIIKIQSKGILPRIEDAISLQSDPNEILDEPNISCNNAP